MDHSSAIVPINPGDEIEVDRAKLTKTAVLVRKDGVWIELRPPAGLANGAEAEKNAAMLGEMIDQICASKNVFQGDGPPMALFRTPPDATGAVKTYVYESFGTDGLKREGFAMRGMETFGEALKNSTGALDAWLQPRRTLVWRLRPIVDFGNDKLWRVYWRCVQLEDGARSVPIDWHF